jgi:hypothetical protein
MKHSHPIEPAEHIQGQLRHPIFSPKGGIEGVLIDIDGKPAQLLIDKHETDIAQTLALLSQGQSIEVEASPAAPSEKGEGAHPVWDLHKLLKVNGRKPDAKAHAADADGQREFSGVVARLNYAKHGEANGVVLDSGDFIHLKPDGFKVVKPTIGDKIKAVGPAQPLAHGGGFVVEATRVNGHAMPKKPKPKHH